MFSFIKQTICCLYSDIKQRKINMLFTYSYSNLFKLLNIQTDLDLDKNTNTI